MDKLKIYIRHVMLLEFKNGKSPSETAKKNSRVYAQGFIIDH